MSQYRGYDIHNRGCGIKPISQAVAVGRNPGTAFSLRLTTMPFAIQGVTSVVCSDDNEPIFIERLLPRFNRRPKRAHQTIGKAYCRIHLGAVADSMAHIIGVLEIDPTQVWAFR